MDKVGKLSFDKHKNYGQNSAVMAQRMKEPNISLTKKVLKPICERYVEGNRPNDSSQHKINDNTYIGIITETQKHVRLDMEAYLLKGVHTIR